MNDEVNVIQAHDALRDHYDVRRSAEHLASMEKDAAALAKALESCVEGRPFTTGQADPDRPTLRDQFAMAALTGILASETTPEMVSSEKVNAKMAYLQADAMIKERGQ